MTTWPDLGERLAQDLMGLATGDTVIFHAGKRYVQLLQLPSYTHGEASSNEFLRDVHRLTSDQERQLREHGWQDPDPGMSNWKLDLPWPATAPRLRDYATTLIDTLHTVFGTATPDQLRVEAWNDTTGEVVPLPLAITQALTSQSL